MVFLRASAPLSGSSRDRSEVALSSRLTPRVRLTDMPIFRASAVSLRLRWAGALLVFAMAAAVADADTEPPTPAEPSDGPVTAVTTKKIMASPQPPVLPPAPVVETVPLDHHPWARFAIGSWRTMRTITETFDENGKFLVRSETLHTDKLTEVTEETYTIETSSVVEVGGKRLRGATQVITHCLWSDHCGESPLVTTLPKADISLSGRTIPCQRWELSIGEGPKRRLETVYYAADFAPHFLRREVVAADGSSAADVTGVTSRVIGVDVPILLDGGMIAGYQRLVQTTAGANQTERMELCCAAAPGGLVQASATERDASGRRVRWVVTELDDFGQEGDRPKTERRWRLFPRRNR